MFVDRLNVENDNGENSGLVFSKRCSLQFLVSRLVFTLDTSNPQKNSLN